MKGLTTGRMVHFVAGDGQHLAAIICCVVDDAEDMLQVNLKVLRAWLEGMFTFCYCKYDGSPNPRAETWHWIERDE